ncbi:MAG: hypothetical protein A3G33_07250 [Omnitrophica bacterium RIFCSPLOWO2_12_FULL_44_17]|uniref:Uncharacterized protein n=1 Tax=Candidatus Danuiimicrobium aquiferis TaxID=1801832 RepID=A0A1G1KYV5_9BACT|nr:MAG: hypothetical protein A3B72_07550 [Omnitrophica bacterium RIFCSPHIGHO2_02_FULL_45_28]OGW90400.1 MAG: hypothetical protein A3E74_07285 [Omnitrophica bacterium RIFCSPHIGHO2_12_FULL_44_12]OGW98022.1 MAG: hypothetical protein A3G33_07250 [Omnitrophica bacterium RIFCSPLOWO2_12_FULL_44_17]OGX03533.1 MAG: hypothetical protein A3J12_02980 [Omnitrophica bacterium RIFCSPLOWO2_02_FULL_44_11]
MAKILFFNPPSRQNVYIDTNVHVGAPSYPSLTLATLAGNLIPQNDVKIIDLELFSNPEEALFNAISEFSPDIVAASANTPAYPVVKDLMDQIKEKYPSIKTIVGGVHITSLPEEVGKEKYFDVAVIGEGDTVIRELISNEDLRKVPGILFRDSSGQLVQTEKRELLKDLDSLPYPAWQLFDINKYCNSRLSARKNPVGLLETSRGCAFQCNFCNKLTFGSRFRVKSPQRVVDEIEYMLKAGFREIHIMDDSFTQDINRAKEICIEIVRRNLKFPWAFINGIRVDMVDLEFFKLAKKSGCWQVGFGIESGDQKILDRINKKTNLAEIENAVKSAQKSGISTFGFFILALAGETEDSIRRTIDFAKKLPLDIAKFDICIPYPGTPYFKELKSENRIRSENWAKYSCHQTEEPLFEHPNVSWPTISKYYKQAFREFYLRPSYIARRFLRSLKRGDLIYDFCYFIKSRW